jgi:hypothetical protein
MRWRTGVGETDYAPRTGQEPVTELG